MKLRAAILGATGYVGAELVRLLAGHESVTIEHLVSGSQAGESLAALYPGFSSLTLPELTALDIPALHCDVVFTSLPHGASADVIPALHAAGHRVIDMSGDYRYDDAAVYAQWYHTEHPSPELLKKSVYGLSELHRGEIAQASLIGNPGCYTTCSILALAPLVRHGVIDSNSIVIDAKSGATGAGRGLSQPTHFVELNGNMKAYNIARHRHTSEIEQELSLLAGKDIALSFTPHLVGINRGILATCYATLTRPVTQTEIDALYMDFYAGEPFVHYGGLPELKHVVGSNRCALGSALDARTNRVVVVSCIDNLIKGAAGQAIQNMNILFGLPETTGLSAAPWQL